MCAVSSQPGAVSSAKVWPMPVIEAPNAASASKIAPMARLRGSAEMKQATTASVQASIEIASSRPME